MSAPRYGVRLRRLAAHGRRCETLHAAVFHVAWRGASARPNYLAPDATPDARWTAPPAPIENSSYIDGKSCCGHHQAMEPSPRKIFRRAHPRATSRTLSPLRFTGDGRVDDEEATSLRRLIALRADAALDATFCETARAAVISIAAQAERIWTRNLHERRRDDR